MKMRLIVIINMVLLLAAKPCFSQTWLPVGDGIGCHQAERVHDISIAYDNSKLLIAGFIIQNGLCDTMRTVLNYNGVEFQSIATSTIGTESTLAIEYNGNIYCSGFLVSQPDPNMNFNIKTEEGIWDTVPHGYDGSAQDYFVRDGIVYLAGSFSTCGSIPCDLVCSYDGQQVSPYYTGAQASGGGYAIEEYQDTIFVAGSYTAPNGLHTQGYSNCSKIVNGQLERVGQGFHNSGAFYDMEQYDGKLFMGGASSAYGITGLHTIYYYENGQLHTLPTEPNNVVNAIKAYNGGLFVAGDFTEIGDMPCNNIARWDGETWTCLNHEELQFIWYTIKDIEIWNDTLYIGGGFDHIGDTELKRIAKLDMALSEAFPVNITEQQRQELKLNIYPNPAKHELNITLPIGASAKDVIGVYDMHGRLIQEQVVGKYGGILSVDIQHLSSGMYVLRYQGKDVVLMEQFVRE